MKRMQTNLLSIAVLAAAGLGLAACSIGEGREASIKQWQMHNWPTGKSEPQAYVRYVPERVDDIAWENDRIAFRIYGPELETAAPPFSSGIDVWSKSVRTPVINDWYAAGEHAYHINHGIGMDCYKVGAGRGAGGLGIWNDDKLYVAHDWVTFKNKSEDPKTASFKIQYAPWRVTTPTEKVSNPGAPGRKVWETRTISLTMGSNLNRIESTIYSNQPGELIVAIGLATHSDSTGQLMQDRDTGRMTWWDKSDRIEGDPNDNGNMGTALIVDPSKIVKFVTTKDDNLVLIRVMPGKPFVYYAGACWSQGLDFHAATQWNAYVKNFKADLKSDDDD